MVPAQDLSRGWPGWHVNKRNSKNHDSMPTLGDRTQNTILFCFYLPPPPGLGFFSKQFLSEFDVTVNLGCSENIRSGLEKGLSS